MPKFDVTIWYTVAFSHDVQIEAATEDEVYAKANEIFATANVIADWGYDGGDLEIDVLEIDEEE